MWHAVGQLIDSMFVGPIWPASVLLLLIIAYLGIALVASFEFQGADFDPNADGWESLGAATVRWLNLDKIPIVIWLGIFAGIQWGIAYLGWYAFDSSRFEPTWLPSVGLAIRNATLAGLLTRWVTGAIAPYIGAQAGYDHETLLGGTAIVSSGEATPQFGQARYDTGGAPLLLNVRTDGPHLTKGTRVKLLFFEPAKRTYVVTPCADPDEPTEPTPEP
ncbi:MAG: DUF1449 family protein [Planctomycetaceae bacterium]|nr:MAG: DUF1449 family protein [Planctomycetaceae bacterium]